MEHRCEKMPSFVSDFVKFYFSPEEHQHIYYCHYCGTRLLVREWKEEDANGTK